jgi:nucleotide-binding universal stress UspA family protein
MAYKTILVHLDRGKHVSTRVEVAAKLALDFQAHLTGLYAVNPIATYTSADPSLLAVNTQVFEEQAQHARRLFGERARRAGLNGAEFRSTLGDALDQLSMHARYADLVVVGQTDPDEGETGVAASFPQVAALATGRPLLVIPYYASAFENLGREVLVAWNASREAARAVTDALPLLQRARKVTVLAIKQKSGSLAHGDIPGADMALYLARHGVKAEAAQSYADGIEVGDELLARAADLQSDLIVMGAYGHSRLREIVLGGVTRNLMSHMTAPVLMAH